MVKIMVEVLTILGILTDEIGQGRISMSFQVDLSAKLIIVQRSISRNLPEITILRRPYRS